MRARSSGYIAIDRKIFEHPMFRGRTHWLVAWQWMIARAAWKPQGQTMSSGVADLARGQIATTLRDLAGALQWRKSTVEYFLNRLQAEQMIEVSTVRTKSRTRIGTKNSHPATLITICNYDKFQTSPQRSPIKVGQELGQELGQEPAQPTLFSEQSGTLPIQPYNQNKQAEVPGNLEDGKRAPPTKHGTRSNKHGTIFILRGSDEWNLYAADFREVRGVEPMPRDGGYWFYAVGERARPAQQQYWKKVRFGAARRA